MGARFIDAWHRAERGESVSERHLSFDSFETMTRVLTPKRLALLHHLHRQPTASVAALSLAVKRDYKQGHEGVEALALAGLIERAIDGKALSAPYETIQTVIAIQSSNVVMTAKHSRNED
jgi:predicted transcriptional regulator